MLLLYKLRIPKRNAIISKDQVHRCGPGGIMRACHAAGPGSIPGRDRFPGWGFFRGFSSPVRQMSGGFRPPRSPNIIWPSLSSSLIIHYGHQWPEMLTRPKTLNIHTYQRPITFDLNLGIFLELGSRIIQVPKVESIKTSIMEDQAEQPRRPFPSIIA